MPSNIDQPMIIQRAIENYLTSFAAIGISLRLRRNFSTYVAIRRANGDTHLNQTFDPQYIKFGEDDFWILAENRCGEPVATYCMRLFVVDDFYDLIRSQALWFGDRPRLVDPRFVVACAIPSFGGEVAHGGGLWVRGDYRGSSRLAAVLPRLARAIALRNHSIDHDSGMIRNDPRDSAPLAERKAAFLGIRTYGFARVHRFVDGWFPPEGRNAIMHLCHATRAEAVASLAAPLAGVAARGLERVEFRQPALVDQNKQLVDPPAVGGEGQKQARI
jgi:hypothetical protein